MHSRSNRIEDRESTRTHAGSHMYKEGKTRNHAARLGPGISKTTSLWTEKRRHAATKNDSTHTHITSTSGQNENPKTSTQTYAHQSFLMCIYKGDKIQCRFQAGPIPNRYNNRLQASSNRGALRLAYSSGSLALKTGLLTEPHQLFAAKPPVGEHSGLPTRVGSCIENRTANRSLKAHELSKP